MNPVVPSRIPPAAFAVPPCVLHEDEDLLVVSKPAGWNTHAPAPHSGEGIHDWFRHREPRWARLAILHRLDKDTSGILVFGKSERANRSLTAQFTERRVAKTYRFRPSGTQWRADGSVQAEALGGGRWRVTSWLEKSGERQLSRPRGRTGEEAITEFEPVGAGEWLARPRTGRTHQIRVHAAAMGAPIQGDVLYGGIPSWRLWLHAGRIEFEHPSGSGSMSFETGVGEAAWGVARGVCVRVGEALYTEDETNAGRVLHGSSSGCPAVFADRLSDRLLVWSESAPDLGWIEGQLGGWRPAATYWKRWRRDVRLKTTEENSPVLVAGEARPGPFEIRENGVRYEASMEEGYSHGLFLDQRDNRRRVLRSFVSGAFPFLEGGLAGRTVLNCFAYTGGFSVCAALAGARVTTLDLSRKYLDWARKNFGMNGVDPAAHDFIYGDCFDWIRRLGKKGRKFDLVLLDPPTFSRSKEHGDFRAESDYGELVRSACGVLSPGGVLFASTNAARLEPERFLMMVRRGVGDAGLRVRAECFVPQPPDHPVSPGEPAYLKTVWVRTEVG